MKASQITILFVLAAVAACGNIRQEHNFNPLESLNPIQTMQLMSGDWTAILPESVRGIARKLLGKEEEAGPMGMLSKAQGLLGGGDSSSSSGIGSLLGGLGGLGGSSESGSGASSALSGFSSLMGGDKSSSAGGLADMAKGFMSHKNQKETQ
jgi:hypothetical protein